MSGYKILHKKSIQGVPQTSAITYGELAVRYGENNEAILLKNNNDKIVSIDAHPKISENYESITYPQSSNVIFESVISGQTIESAVSVVENNVLKLIDETIKNEEIIASAISNISDAVGLDSNLSYLTNDSANYISGATSLTDADDKLDAAIFNVSERLKNLEDENNDYITENDLNNALSDYVTLDDIKTYNGSTNIFIDDTNNQISVKHDSSLNDSADGLQVNLNENGGLSLDNNGIYIKCSSGLTNNSNGININLGEGIKFDVNSALTLNLKTINNQSLLGNGNITITGSSSSDGSYDDSEIRQNINTIGESIGLKSDFTYNPNISANYISGATSVAEATNILDNKIKNLLKVEGTTLTLNL